MQRQQTRRKAPPPPGKKIGWLLGDDNDSARPESQLETLARRRQDKDEPELLDIGDDISRDGETAAAVELALAAARSWLLPPLPPNTSKLSRDETLLLARCGRGRELFKLPPPTLLNRLRHQLAN